MVNVRLSPPCWQWKEAALAAIRGCLMIMSHYFQYMISWGIELRMNSFQARMNSFQTRRNSFYAEGRLE